MNQPDLQSLLTVVLQAAAAIALFWLCLPNLLHLLGLAFHNGIAGGPSDVEPDGTDASHEDLHRQLEALGFTSLGRYWEGMRFGKTFHELVYVCEREGCFAAIFGLAHADHHVAFVTTFTDGAAAITKNIDGLVTSTDGLRASYVPTNILAEILAEHRRVVREFRAAGRVPTDDYTLPGFQSAQRAYFENPSNQANHRSSAAALLLIKLVVVAAVFLPLASLLGFQPGRPGLWLALLAASLGYISFERWLIRRSMETLSAERQEHDARV
jgi:hypothetical protein